MSVTVVLWVSKYSVDTLYIDTHAKSPCNPDLECMWIYSAITEVLDSQLSKALNIVATNGGQYMVSYSIRLTKWAGGLYLAVKFAEMIIDTSMASHNLSGCSKVPLIHPD